jgi:hypothetical protein
MDKKYDTRENIKKILKYWKIAYIVQHTKKGFCPFFIIVYEDLLQN